MFFKFRNILPRHCTKSRIQLRAISHILFGIVIFVLVAIMAHNNGIACNGEDGDCVLVASVSIILPAINYIFCLLSRPFVWLLGAERVFPNIYKHQPLDSVHPTHGPKLSSKEKNFLGFISPSRIAVGKQRYTGSTPDPGSIEEMHVSVYMNWWYNTDLRDRKKLKNKEDKVDRIKRSLNSESLNEKLYNFRKRDKLVE